MSQYEPARPSTGPSAQIIEQLFADLADQFDRTMLLYGNAGYFDLERARQIRQSFDARLAKAESQLLRDRPAQTQEASAASPGIGHNRAQRIEGEILSFIQDMQKPVTIDEVLDHLNNVSLGEPRASLITRMSRMVAADKLTRSGRGYYEIME